MDYFRKALSVNPDYEEAHLNLGAHLLENEPELAKLHFTWALEIDPAYSHAARGLGMCFWGTGDHKLALEYAERAAEMDPTNADNWVFAGECHFTVLVKFAEPEGSEGRVEQLNLAQHTLEHAIELAPTDATSHLMMALLHRIWGTEELVEGLLPRPGPDPGRCVGRRCPLRPFALDARGTQAWRVTNWDTRRSVWLLNTHTSWRPISPIALLRHALVRGLLRIRNSLDT
ncbi:MAG: tetratricopeptide repeat protein [bacterium]|nr:tetratricopeptide repeat protein [bacterium]